MNTFKIYNGNKGKKCNIVVILLEIYYYINGNLYKENFSRKLNFEDKWLLSSSANNSTIRI